MRAQQRSSPDRALAYIAAVFVFALCLLAAVSTADAAPLMQAGGPGQQIFQTKCTGCHTIGGGKLVGPDLKGVTERRDRTWLHNFILDPAKMIAAKDPTAVALLAENNNLTMPTLGLSPADVDAVITYLAAATAGGAAAPPPVTGPVGYVDVGQRLFTGEQRLTAGGPPCLTCHSVSGTGALGGGRLGPDLTHVAQRYNGATGLIPVLTNIAFPTMIGPFTGHALTPSEVGDIVAFLQDADARQPPVPQIAAGTVTPDFWRVLLLGLGGAALLTLLMLAFWPRQRQSISNRLRTLRRAALR